MMKSSNIPAQIREACGSELLAVVLCCDGRWLAASRRYLVVFNNVINPPDLQRYEWAAVETASFAGEDQSLTVNFVDPNQESLEFVLREGKHNKFVRAFLERVDDSIVFQHFIDLPSGEQVHAQIRRAADGSLFAQMPWEKVQDVQDREFLQQEQIVMLESVGM